MEESGPFAGVDWSRTRAYAVGLNGLYANVKGREAQGIVAPHEREALIAEISDKLLRTIDPATGAAAVSKMFRREQIYTMDGHEESAPDAVVGYAKGTRGSDASALGELMAETIVDNRDAWSGDHCMDPDAVPGILLSSRPLRQPAPNLQAVASAILAEFGINGFPRTK